MTDNARRNRQPPSLEDLLNSMDDDQADGVNDPGVEESPDWQARPTSQDFIGRAATRPSDGEYIGAAYEKAKFSEKIKQKPQNRSRLAYAPTRSERRWATIAHAAAVATIIGGIGSADILALFLLAIPLGIYFYWRTRSEFVAYQALQAFAFQALGTIGWLILLIGGAIVGALIIALLAILIVTIPLLLIAIPVYVLYLIGVVFLPFVALFYSMIAAFQTWRGYDYRIPFIGRWVEQQLTNGFMNRF